MPGEVHLVEASQDDIVDLNKCIFTTVDQNNDIHRYELKVCKGLVTTKGMGQWKITWQHLHKQWCKGKIVQGIV